MDKKTSKFPLSTIAGAHRESVYYSAAITSEGARGVTPSCRKAEVRRGSCLQLRALIPQCQERFGNYFLESTLKIA
jgi:hypothetical protein